MNLFSLETVYAASQAECVARSFLEKINNAVFYPLIIFLTALAFLLFLWGAFRFVWSANESSSRENGRRHMMFGIIGLLIMVSAWAILEITANTFDLGVPSMDSCGGAPAPSPDRKPMTPF